MKEFVNKSIIELEVTNPITGESFRTHGEASETSRYYAISRITSRINAMDLLTKVSHTCK